MGFVPNTRTNDKYSYVRQVMPKDGYMYVGGSFSTFGGVTGLSGLCRYSIATGEVDSGWKPSGLTDGAVSGSGNSIAGFAFSSDGTKIFAASTGSGAATRGVWKITVSDASATRIVGLSAATSLTAWGDGTYFWVGVNAASFTMTPTTGPTFSCAYIGKIQFSDDLPVIGVPSLNGAVYSITGDGTYVYLGGAFTTATGVTTNNIVKINSDGTVAADWSHPGTSVGTVYSVLAASNSSLYLAGNITNWGGTALGAAARLIKISKTGTRDTAFVTGSSATFTNFHVTSDILGGASHLPMIESGDSIIVGTSADALFQGTATNGLLKVNKSTRAIDATFAGKMVENSVRTIASDGENLHCGTLYASKYQNARLIVHPIDATTGDTVACSATNHYAPPTIEGTVNKQVKHGSYVYVAGSFTSVNNVTGFRGVCRYNSSTGELDSSWKPQNATSSTANCLDVSTDGLYLYVGFTGANGIRRFSLSDATSITVSSFNTDIKDLKVDNGTVFACGGWTSVNGSSTASTSKYQVIKFLESTNAIEDAVINVYWAMFNGSSTSERILIDGDAVYVLTNGSVDIDGASSSARLHKLVKTTPANIGDPVTYPGWNGGAGTNNSTIDCILKGSNGSIYIGGSWTTWNGASLSTTQGRTILKLDTNGNRDTNFTTDAGMATLRITALTEHNGALYAGLYRQLSVVKKSTGLNGFQEDASFVCPGGMDTGNYQARNILVENNQLLTSVDYAYPHTGIGGVKSGVAPLDRSTGKISYLSLVDSAAPTASLSSAFASGASTSLASVSMTATFSESVTGFAAADLVVSNATVSNFSGSGSSYTFDIAPSAAGAVSVQIPADVCTDGYGNNNSASTTYSFTYDNVGPTVALSSGAVASGASTGSASVAMTATFSESVTGFVAGDISTTNCSISGFSGSGSVYTFNVLPTAAGSVSVSVSSGVCQDSVGNNNSASTAYSFTYATGNLPAGFISATTGSVNQLIPVVFTRSELSSNSKVTGYFTTIANWKNITVHYRTVQGVRVNATQRANDDFSKNFKAAAAGNYRLQKIVIKGRNGQLLTIKRADIPNASSMDVTIS